MLWFEHKMIMSKSKVEVKIAEQKASAKKVSERSQKSSNKLINTIEENGFTLNIALALGAKHQSKHRKGAV